MLVRIFHVSDLHFGQPCDPDLIEAIESHVQDGQYEVVAVSGDLSQRARAGEFQRAKAFLRDARVLAEIPGVTNFEQLRQVSPKNEYCFAFSMEFSSEAAYQAYNAHPKHLSFVKDRWQREVDKFLEADYSLADAGAST